MRPFYKINSIVSLQFADFGKYNEVIQKNIPVFGK